MKSTRLTFEGVAPEEVTVDLMVEFGEVPEEHGLDVRGVGMNWRESCGEGHPSAGYQTRELPTIFELTVPSSRSFRSL